ncbi:MAG: ArsR/SmtB family transcription factor [Microbacteriaceae bacterium]
MANHSTTLDSVFSALSDPHRRAMMTRLSRGPATVSQLSEPLSMALPSVMKHITVLTRAGLITSEKRGRVRVCTIRTAPLDDTAEWIEEHRRMWTTRLTALNNTLSTTNTNGATQ